MIRVICYDVKDDKRRNKLFKFLKDYGQWVQYSVFELKCSDIEWIQVEHRLKSMLSGDDSLCVYQLCKSCTKKIHYDQKLSENLKEQQTNIM
ncbi:CRISPR-associated protein, Cas2 family [Seinonella peptonophila]|uniref:CRISPR-associated endoribonuclease Cas2 n=1 Tax=Seinonella peptonophila TaxID=112248 RepID=A0A1M5B501_9BACL|nr:CRISPR-associated endonuclease Cas2 [Seinonella peptonophila]SHF37518.1 CRISPR-associated protein, Cas2 family [Seinonella peptonophila]